MKKQLLFTALAATCALGAHAQEQGRVLSATPITQQVAIPQQVCDSQSVYSPSRQPTGAGAVLGAIAGGAAGNAIGKGGGRAATTMIGVIGGALLGNQIERGRPGYQDQQRCTTETFYDNRVIGYDVVYEFAGRQYSTRTQNDPGQWIPLVIRPNVPAMHESAPNYPAPQPGYSGYQNQPGYADYPQQPGYGYNSRPGVVVGTPPGPPVYVTPPVATVIEYRDAYGRPYYPQRQPQGHWR